MQKVLGADRLLFVEVPELETPQKGQDASLIWAAYKSFAANHCLDLLGRTYRPLCFKAREWRSQTRPVPTPSRPSAPLRIFS